MTMHVNDSDILIVDETDGTAYIFRDAEGATAEQWAAVWSEDGAPTYAIARPATSEELSSACAAINESNL